jgi:hypothetical protein
MNRVLEILNSLVKNYAETASFNDIQHIYNDVTNIVANNQAVRFLSKRNALMIYEE